MYVAIIVNNACLVATKISVLLLFLDIFVITWVRKATYVVTGSVVFYGLWVTVSNITICTPIHRYWEPRTDDRGCRDMVTKFVVENSLNIAYDFVLLALPVPVVWPMMLQKKQKLWLYSVFVLGCA